MDASRDCRRTLGAWIASCVLATTAWAQHSAAPESDVLGSPVSSGRVTPVASAVSLPSDWWQLEAGDSLRPGCETIPVTLDGVLLRAVTHAPQIRVFSDLPLIRRTAIDEAAAAWDWSAFVDTRWDDIQDPVGNELTTGGSPQFSDHHWSGSAGLRRRTTSGGNFEVSQRYGWQDTNSDFFIPDQQGTARLSLSYTQPLLRGRGRKYNESLLILARVDAGIAEHEFSRQLQAHLIEVIRAYWGLYLERASLVQKRAALERAQELKSRLELRARLDSVISQIERAGAEVALREAELLRARMAVANSETRLRTLVGDDSLGRTALVELVPLDTPSMTNLPVDIEQAVQIAVQRRPEVLQALQQIKAAAIRLDMSRNELLPTLNLVTELYISGLEGDGRVGRAWQSQFDEGAPSYTLGLTYEMALGNRAGKARLQRKQLEFRQLENQYRTTLETLGLEVEVAVREVETATAEVEARSRQTTASRTQLDYLTRRWELLPGEDGTSSLILESLLDAQDRVADAEFSLVSSRVTRDLAVLNMRKATGELLDYEQVDWGVGCVDGMPTTVVDKRPVRSNSEVTFGNGSGSSITPPTPGPPTTVPSAPVSPVRPVSPAQPVPSLEFVTPVIPPSAQKPPHQRKASPKSYGVEQAIPKAFDASDFQPLDDPTLPTNGAGSSVRPTPVFDRPEPLFGPVGGRR